MKKLLTILCLLFSAGRLHAQLPSGTGWHQLSNTKINDVCACTHGFPSVCGTEGCAAIESWSGGLFDTTRNRAIVFGGGHNAYYGNELYAFNLNSTPPTMTRLNDPYTVYTACNPAVGAQPLTRHTYDGLEYMANQDRMWIFGGAMACISGGFSTDTWTFSFASMTWTRMSPSGPTPGNIITSAYDPNTGKVFLHDATDLFSYDYGTNAYTRHSSNGSNIGYHFNAVIDPVRKRYVIVGPDAEAANAARVYSYDIAPTSSYVKQTLSTTGGDAFISTTYPGLAYYPTTDRIVGWNGGNLVYSLNLDTNTWTTTSFSTNPGTASATQGRGTHGRFRYSTASGVFTLVNGTGNDAWILRLAAGPPDTEAPTNPSSLSASVVSSSAINLNWTASTDNVAVTGYQVERCSGASCSSFSQIATPTSNSHPDTGLAASTSYSYRVRATDGTNLSGYSNTASATTSASGGSDFTSRCAAAGVVRCFGFDSTTDFNIGSGGTNGAYGENFGIMPPSGTSNYSRIVRDTTQAASGASSMKMIVPSNSGADASGSWFTNFSSDLLTQFGANQTFYVQWRQRFDTAFTTTVINKIGGGPQGGLKQTSVTTGDKPGGPVSSSCQATTLVTETYYQSIPRFPTVYNSCTGSASHGPYEHLYEQSPTDFLLQNGVTQPGCLYTNAGASGCRYWFANEWMTFKMRVDVGPRSGDEWTNSRTRMWVAREGQASELMLDFRPGIMGYFQLSAGPAIEDQKFGKIWLLPYMTEKDPAQTHAEMNTWYDELIISTQDIADPSEVEGGESSVPVLSSRRRRQ